VLPVAPALERNGCQEIEGGCCQRDPEDFNPRRGSFSVAVKEVLGRFNEITAGKTNFLRKYGTAGVIIGTQNFGVLPTRNFQSCTFEDFEKIGGEAIAEQYLISSKSCFSCPIGCGR